MKIDKTVGTVGISLNTGRLDSNLREAQKKLNMQIVIDCDPFIPSQQGQLRGSVGYPEGLYGREIAYDAPHAHFQYEGELYLAANGSSWAKKDEQKFPAGTPLEYHAPGTTDHWFDVAKEQNMNQWIDLVKRTAGKG